MTSSNKSRIIIVTGGAGFIGSNFLNRFVPSHPEITWINIDSLTYAGKTENISSEVKTLPNYRFEQIDICNIDALRGCYEQYSPTDIIHFAAESHVDNSIANPRIFTETNVLGTQNLLDLHREFGLHRFHYISTDEVYGDLEAGYFRETDSLHPSNPYAASKAGGEVLTKAYGRTFDIDYVITRCSNNYGPNQDEEKLIPRFLSLLGQDKNVPLYGNGSNVRDWLYVDDHCDAVWEVFTRARNKSIYNIGGNNEYTNLEITNTLLELMRKDESYIEFVPDRPGHDIRYALDSSKIKDDLGWEPTTPFGEGIQKTIQSYAAN